MVWFFRRIITVHPVGGSPMGRNDDEGVCDRMSTHILEQPPVTRRPAPQPSVKRAATTARTPALGRSERVR